MTPNVISAFEAFLKWGPIGFAALMLVLVVFAMTTSELTGKRAIVLSLFMVVGGACFIAALVFDNKGAHPVFLTVLPNDMEESGFSAPLIKVNNRTVDRSEPIIVANSTTLSIDVNRALNEFLATNQRATVATAQADQATRQLEEANEVVTRLETETAEISNALQLANQEIATKTATLEAALETSGALEQQFEVLRAEVTRAAPRTTAPAPVQRQLLDLERGIQGLTNGVAGALR